MKNNSILITVLTLFFAGLLIISCSVKPVNDEPEPAVVETEVPTKQAEPGPAEVETEVPTNQADLEPTATEIAISARFTIQADPGLKDPISALYEAYFQGEVPTFVDSDPDLLVTGLEDATDQRPVVKATFLPDTVLISKSSALEVSEFISFSISPDGQEVLINVGALPATITLNDQAGNSVEIAQPVRRVISSHGPSTALIYSVGAGDRLVSASYLGARDPLGAAVMEKIEPRFPEIMGDDFFSQQDFNIEQAAMLDPDLIITSARTAWIDTADQLGIPVFLFDAETPTQLQEAILLTGELFGPHTSAQARAWVSYYRGIISSVQTQVSDIPNDERVRVLFTGTNPLRVASGDMLQTDLIETAGGISVSSELGGFWNDINLEQVVIWDPDIIIVPPYGGASVEAITESPEWQILRAVQEGQVYRMPKLVVPWDTPAPDSVLGVIWMAQRLNPDFVEFNCADEASYFYSTFYNYLPTDEEIDLICTFE